MVIKLKIDNIDKKLMQLIYTDARQPYSKLAQQLGISPSTVRSRLNRLIDEGLVSIVGIPNQSYVDTYEVILGLSIAHNKLQSALKKLITIPGVLWAMAVTGRYDILARLRLANKDELYYFIDEKLSAIDGIISKEAFICIELREGTEVTLVE